MKTNRKLAAVCVASALALAACSGSGGSTGGSPSTAPASASSTAAAPSTSTSSTSTATAPTSSTASSGSGTAPVHQQLHDFRITDASFVGRHEWVLGSAQCLSGGGTCDAIETSTDGGRRWHSAPAPRAAIGSSSIEAGCTSDCVDYLRFASTTVGYAWAPYASNSFFMTTDGGASWQPESGRVVALEALDGNVMRVVAPTDCPPDCSYRVQIAGVGSTSWHTVDLPGAPAADGAVLARSGGVSYLLLTQNPAGGAQDATSTLFVSTDNGEQWTGRGEPCPQLHGKEVDSSLLTAAADGSATVLCRERIHQDVQFTATTDNDGASFRAGSTTALGAGEVTGFGAASSSVLLVAIADTFRSTDGGHSFDRLAADAGSSPGDPSWIGFASSTVGYAITANGRALATTTDAGATWSLHTFS